MPALILKPGRERSLLRRHPWIFSGAVGRLEDEPEPGGTLDLLSSKGDFLARAAYSPRSNIRARVWTFDRAEPVDEAFFRRRIRSSLAARCSLRLEGGTDALRLVHAESDGLPGLIVDRYGDVLVIQFLTAGAELWRETLADLMLEETGAAAIYERSDSDVRELEGLPSRTGFIRNTMTRDSSADAALESLLSTLTITEHDLHFKVDIVHGHKTGFYLDQRLNRLRVRELAEGRETLDCFCYTGGFTVNALAGGAASVLSVDSSAEALALCRENVGLNSGGPESASRHSIIEGDVFHLLRRFRDEGRLFDLIVLDPPKFAPTAAQAEKAARGYKDINLLGFKLLRPGGLLVTFSCSGGVDAALFQKIVAAAVLDAGAEAQILERLAQGPDHPAALSFPEGAYLKGLICRKGGTHA
jgi:23S rRNA (cytosine1962-C5)-methyltransferase